MISLHRTVAWAIFGVLGLGTLVVAVAFTASAQGGGTTLGRPAPEIAGGPWINSQPLGPAALRGHVVFVDFWTYG